MVNCTRWVNCATCVILYLIWFFPFFFLSFSVFSFFHFSFLLFYIFVFCFFVFYFHFSFFVFLLLFFFVFSFFFFVFPFSFLICFNIFLFNYLFFLVFPIFLYIFFWLSGLSAFLEKGLGQVAPDFVLSPLSASPDRSKEEGWQPPFLDQSVLALTGLRRGLGPLFLRP